MNLDKYIEHILLNYEVKTSHFCGDLYVYPIHTEKPILQLNFDLDSILVSHLNKPIHRVCVDDSDLFEVLAHYLSGYRR